MSRPQRSGGTAFLAERPYATPGFYRAVLCGASLAERPHGTVEFHTGVLPGARDRPIVLSLGAKFMEPFWAPECRLLSVPMESEEEAAAFVKAHPEAAFAYAMNMAPAPPPVWYAARDACRERGIPTVWHTIEDPNSHEAFLPQGKHFDVVATTDCALCPTYARRFPLARVVWLPLAAQPALHFPKPEAADAADFVLLANWYENPARAEGVRAVVDPLLEAGHSLALFSYPTHRWPAKYDRWWRGGTKYLEVASYYPAGRVALGLNNQNCGTAMTSMRTFEALACGKPMLAAASTAYAALGFEWGKHFFWADGPAASLEIAARLLQRPEEAAALARRGREFVLQTHSYRERLRTLLGAVK